MVDKKTILNTFHQYFQGQYFQGIDISEKNIDANGFFNSDHDVKMVKDVFATGKLPVKFGKVYSFAAVGTYLQSLENTPRIVAQSFDIDSNPLGKAGLKGGPEQVGGNYWCNNCDLETLLGAPKKVSSFYCNFNKLLGGPAEVADDFFCMDNPLKSLEGLPKIIPGELRLNYDKDLPLLRALGAGYVSFGNHYEDESIAKVHNILLDYVGKGKRAMFDCQKALEDAGFPGNARW
jgi:hypothetical protein